MINLEQFNPRKSLKLIGHKENFDFLNSMIQKDKLPQSLLVSGDKGIGKSTLVFHLLHNFFDKLNYDITKNEIIEKSSFHKSFVENLYPNLTCLNSSNFNNVRIDDIRSLKEKILTTSLNDNKRFIIFDDIENFNLNSLNALLKIIEEPNKNIFFILINNNSKDLIETIKSRCFEVKLKLTDKIRKEIILYLIKKFEIKEILNKNSLQISPGNYLIFNHILDKVELNLEDNLIKNLNILLKLYKKEKNYIYKNLLVILVDYYFRNLKLSNPKQNIDIAEKRSLIIKNINDFFLYNLSQSSLINTIENKLY